MSRGPDASTLLSRALEGSLPGARITGCRWKSWASATFAGAWHALTVVAPDTDATHTWLAALPEATFTLGRHLVADVTVAAVRRIDGSIEAEIEALTLEE